jgi:tetratricopeptide (TPR) repeat protein
MITKKPLAMLAAFFAASLWADAQGQTTAVGPASPPAVTAPSAATPAPSPSPQIATEYAAFLKRVQQGDLTINYRKFRLDQALASTGKRNAEDTQGPSDRAAFKRLMDAGNTGEALASANRSLERDYASVGAHLDAMTACLKLNRSDEAELPRKIAAALLDSIQRSGDGKSAETAYFVVTIPEEYALVVYRLRMTVQRQSVTFRNGHAYDRLEVIDPKSNQTQTIWFNTDFDMGLYKPPAPRTPEVAAKLQKAFQFYIPGQFLNALPLVEEMSSADPDDALLQMLLADCLSYKANTNLAPEEAQTLLKRAREAALRARQLGDNSARLSFLVAKLTNPAVAPQQFSKIPAANQAMKDGERAFGEGDYHAAIATYSRALQFDSSLYSAAMYIGDACFLMKDISTAPGWFTKALTINPDNATVYLHWADGLMMSGQIAEARDKYIEAVIALPSAQSWAALENWARRTNSQVSPPRIDRPPVGDSPQALAADAEGGAAASPWAKYWDVRAEWRNTLFAEKYPAEKQYRHSIGEEAAALGAVADAAKSQKATHPNPQISILIELKKAGFLTVRQKYVTDPTLVRNAEDPT